MYCVVTELCYLSNSHDLLEPQGDLGLFVRWAELGICTVVSGIKVIKAIANTETIDRATSWGKPNLKSLVVRTENPLEFSVRVLYFQIKTGIQRGVLEKQDHAREGISRHKS